MYDYGARWYDSTIGRFIQADTIVPQPGNPQALNRYSYTLNNPVKYTDPTGHWVESAFDVISLGLTINDIRNEGFTFWNAVSLVTDVASVALPIVPAGASHAIRAGKLASKAINALDMATDAAKLLNATDTVGDTAKLANSADTVGEVTARRAGHRPSLPTHSSEQSLIDDIIQHELSNVRMTHQPVYDPSMSMDTFGIATRNQRTEIGRLAIQEGRRETVITIPTKRCIIDYGHAGYLNQKITWNALRRDLQE